MLMVACVALLAAACGSTGPSNLEQAGAIADAKLETAGPAAATLGARAGDAAGTAGVVAGQAATAVEAGFDDRLVARVWQWQETTGTAGYTAPEDSSSYTVTFVPGGAVAVRADCKQAGGTFTSDTDTMQVDLKVTTTDPCASGSLADTFVAQIAEVVSWAVEAENLTLVLADNAGTMRFTAQ